jgi:ribonucleoside-diphosphate reductase beta chain
MEDGRLKVEGGEFKGKKITFHDPCYLGRANGEYEAPRNLLQKLDAELSEMKRSRANGLCCGAGGGQMFKEAEKGNKEVNIERTDDVLELKPDVVAVGCPFCMTMLKDGVKLNEKEKNLIGNILKSFAQTEVHVNDYWSTNVSKWFPKPEIVAMTSTFGAFESIHAHAYARLNEELGLDDFKAFLEDEASSAKIERLLSIPNDTIEERAQSLAIFSAFTEGVNLFSSFAILMSFQLRNLMKGTGQIVEWSVRDESLHSQAGCWLFRTLLSEQPELNTDELRNKITEACHLSVKLEFDFIEKAFEMGEIEGLNMNQLKNFIKARANEKMIELGYNAVYNDIDPNHLKQMEWFGHLTSGKTHQDFFAGRVTDYAKSTSDWSDL